MRFHPSSAVAALAWWFALPLLAGEPWFRDVAAERGLDFRHQDGRCGEKYYVETAASGGGFFDFDGDGDLDVLLVNGGESPGCPPLTERPIHRLYEQREGRFVDITAVSGVGQPGYGMGFCVGDIDADGRLDFLLTHYGPDRLYRNLGNGRFAEIAVQAGVADPRWSTGCAFGDLDGDFDLDLYVAHYVDFRYDRNPFCGDRARGLRAYCRPEAFDGVDDSLFINQGDGTFKEEGKRRGLASGGKDEKGFGVVLTDVDNDNDLDIYVANDGTMNRLYVNNGKGFFKDEALLAGVGLNARGRAESGMGVDAADLDGNGFVDLIVTNYSMESNTLYRNHGDLMFSDVTSTSGLVESSYKDVGWGVAFFDYDQDSDLDLAVANGHAIDNIEIFEAGLAYRQPSRLLENDGQGHFHEVSRQAGPAFTVERVSRGLAVGDFDNDGRLDLLFTHTNDPVTLLRNQLVTENHWLGVQLVGPPANRFAFGARVTLEAGGRKALREVRSGGSFLSQSDLRLHFGLGRHPGPVMLTVRWPDGRQTRQTIPTVDRYLTVSYP